MAGLPSASNGVSVSAGPGSVGHGERGEEEPAEMFDRLEAAQHERLLAALSDAQSPYSMRVAEAHGMALNRYSNILPFDRNRVVLPSSRTAGSGAEAGDYINASHIAVPTRKPAKASISGGRGDGGDDGTRHYICTQGPTRQSALDFWRMVWAHGDVVVMLCRWRELGREKCHRYLPRDDEPGSASSPGSGSGSGAGSGSGSGVGAGKHGSRTDTAANGDSNEAVYGTADDGYRIAIEQARHDQAADCIVRTLTVERLPSGERKRVTHVHYQGWPDFGRPESADQVAEIVRLVQHLGSASAPIGMLPLPSHP